MGRTKKYHAGPGDAVSAGHCRAGLFDDILLGVLLEVARCFAVCVVARCQASESRVASSRHPHCSWILPSHSSNDASLLGATRLQDHVCARHDLADISTWLVYNLPF